MVRWHRRLALLRTTLDERAVFLLERVRSLKYAYDLGLLNNWSMREGKLRALEGSEQARGNHQLERQKDKSES